MLKFKVLENYTSYDGIYNIWESNVGNMKVNKQFGESSQYIL